MSGSNQVIEVTLKSIDTFSIVSSVASLILGIVSIVLSILFYLMSVKSAKESEAASANIESNVKRLDHLFDKLYSDTFGVMKDTVTDMRKHFYTNGKNVIDNSDVEEEINRKVELKTNEAVTKAVKEIQTANKSTEELEKLILSVIANSKEAEKKVKDSALREAILLYLKNNKDTTYRELKSAMVDLGLIITRDDSTVFFNEVFSLHKENLIRAPFRYDAHEQSYSIGMNARISLKKDIDL